MIRLRVVGLALIYACTLAPLPCFPARADSEAGSQASSQAGLESPVFLRRRRRWALMRQQQLQQQRQQNQQERLRQQADKQQQKRDAKLINRPEKDFVRRYNWPRNSQSQPQ